MYIDKVVLFQLIAVVTAWLISKLIKIVLGYSSFSKQEIFKTGGMPSSHTATASTFLFAELFFNGFTSLSVLALILVIVIMVDAIGVRRTAGLNAQVLSQTTKNKKLKEQILIKHGHTVPQVIVGFLLGLVIAGVLYLI